MRNKQSICVFVGIYLLLFCFSKSASFILPIRSSFKKISNFCNIYNFKILSSLTNKNTVISCKARKKSNGISQNLSLNRKSFLASIVILAGTVVGPSCARGYFRNSKEDIEGVLNGYEWEPDLPFERSDFSRLDETNDAEFYEFPKIVEHLDQRGVQSLTNFYEDFFTKTSINMYGESRVLDVLDLCSSWVSHFPQAYTSKQSKVSGLGMNLEELQRNPQLSDYIVKDLNRNPVLHYENETFDVVVCALSIDYLVKPLSVFREIARVLRPGGSVAIVFSNRLFLSKAVGLWTGKSDIDHVIIVGSYFHYSTPVFSDPIALDLSTSKKTDPLFAVIASKKK